MADLVLNRKTGSVRRAHGRPTEPELLNVDAIGPQRGPQEQFLACSADIAIYGGAAFSGKSVAILLEALRGVDDPEFSAVIFRRTTPQIKKPGGLWSTSRWLYSRTGASPRISDLKWQWPSGCTVEMSHLEHEDTVEEWQGSAVTYIAFDELPHFTKHQFFYMMSRNRLSGLPGQKKSRTRPYMRATCNPEFGSWVRDFIDWWINPTTGLPIPERSGVVRWFSRSGDEMMWWDTPQEAYDKGLESSDIKSFTFIGARITDNQIGMANDPNYLGNLKALSLVERSQLLDGNWNVRPIAGMFFRREWFEIVDVAPAMNSGSVECRYWDRAATEVSIGSSDPDWTAGVHTRYVRGVFYIMDVCHIRERPAKVKQAMINCASQDGEECIVVAEEDPGQAGKSEVEDLSYLFPDRVFDTRRPTQKKSLRARIASAQAEQGNIKLVRGKWNEAYLAELESFADWDMADKRPKGSSIPHDDQVDGTSGGVNYISERIVNTPRARY